MKIFYVAVAAAFFGLSVTAQAGTSGVASYYKSGRLTANGERFNPQGMTATHRTLPFGTGVTLLRSAPPIITDLRAWTSRPDSTQLKEERAGIEARLRRPVDS